MYVCLYIFYVGPIYGMLACRYLG